MNYTLDQFQNDWSHLSELSCQQWEAFYARLMKRLNTFSGQAGIKTLARANKTVQQSLIALMRGLHRVEKTWMFKTLHGFGATLLLTVQQDGLKLVGLLTILGYLSWYLTIS